MKTRTATARVPFPFRLGGEFILLELRLQKEVTKF